MLIHSFSKIETNNFKLKIAGPENNYSKELKVFSKQLNINNKVEFLGMIKGEEKYKLYKEAHVFVAPSYSEVVGMVNLEAAIMNTPVITTFQTGLLKEWNEHGGILVNPNVSEVEEALREAISWTQKQRNARGGMLKEFVLNNYSWERNKNKWIKLYKDLLD